jgi:hypothetical protein
MTTNHQQVALANPLVGREGERLTEWESGPWHYALSFNR